MLLVLTLSVHVCVESLVACSIRHVRFDSFFHPTQVCLRTVEVTIVDRPRQLPHVNAHNSLSRPNAAHGSTKTDYGGADGWQPKSLRNSIWQGKPACSGLPESNLGCPGLNDIMRETADQIQHSRCQAGPRFSLNQGPVHAGVTVAAAPIGISRSREFFCQPQHGLLVRPWEVSLVRRHCNNWPCMSYAIPQEVRLAGSRNARASRAESQYICDGVQIKNRFRQKPDSMCV